MAETLESSDFTSVQRRIQAVEQSTAVDRNEADSSPATVVAVALPEPASRRANDNPILNPSSDAHQPAVPDDAHEPAVLADRFLSPLSLDERTGEVGAVPNQAGSRCSDKGFLPISFADYLKLLDWTGRQLANGKRGRIPNSVAPILERLNLDRKTWCTLVGTFGRRFYHVAGQPTTIDATPSRVSQQRYYIPSQTRKLLQDAASRPTATA